METAANVASVLLAVVLVGSAIGKLTRAALVVENLSKAAVPDSMYPPLAMLEIAGAVGLVAGIWWAPIGIAAAVGVALYFVGAVVFHVRAKDPAVVPPIALGLLGAAVAVLHTMSA